MRSPSRYCVILLAIASLATTLLSGCVVAPLPVRGGPPYAAPAGVVYVAPRYPIPAPGYAWVHHPRHGWGWHHHHHGWHRGWR